MEPLETCLGIPPEDQPPNHYRLFGLPLFESQPEAIRHAVAKARQKVARKSADLDRAELENLNRRLELAAHVLTQAPAKLTYDTRLHDQLWSNTDESARCGDEQRSMHSNPMAASPLEESTDWYLRHGNGVVFGPFAFAQLLQAASSSRIANDTVVCHRQRTDGKWVRAKSLQTLEAAIPRRSPPTDSASVSIPTPDVSSQRQAKFDPSHNPPPSRRPALFTAFALFGVCCIAVAWLSSGSDLDPSTNLHSDSLARSQSTVEATEVLRANAQSSSLNIDSDLDEDSHGDPKRERSRERRSDSKPIAEQVIESSGRPTALSQIDGRTMPGDAATNILAATTSLQEPLSPLQAHSPTQPVSGESLSNPESGVSADKLSSYPRIDKNTESTDAIPPTQMGTGLPPMDERTSRDSNEFDLKADDSPFLIEHEVEPMVYANVWHRALAAFPLATDVRLDLPSGRTIRLGETFRRPQSELREQLTEMVDRCDTNLIRLDYGKPEQPALLISRRGDDLHGPLMSVSEEGSPLALANYRRGKRDGIVMAWDEAGRPSVWEQFVSGKRHGLRCLLKACSPDCKEGHPWMVQEWERGELVASHIAMPKGNIVTVMPPSSLSTPSQPLPSNRTNIASTSATSNPIINDQHNSALAELYRFESRLSSDEDQLRDRVAEYHLQLRRTLSSQSRARLATSRYRSFPLGPTSPYNLAFGQAGFSTVRSVANL